MHAHLRRRICMVTHSAYPDDPRVAREARAALAAGFEVDVIALTETGEAREEVVDGVRVFRLPFTHARGSGFGQAAWEYLGFACGATFRLARLWLRRRYAIVHVHNPPDFLIVAALLPKVFGARVIFDVHDLATDMYSARYGARPASALVDRLLRLCETAAARVADRVVTVHEPYRRELASRGISSAKIDVVMNSVDESILPVEAVSLRAERFRIVYHGSITPHYGVELVIEAAARLSAVVPDLCVEIYGVGDSLPEVEARADELGIAHLVDFSRRQLPQREVLARVRGASVGVIANLPVRLNTYALSSKLFEYVVLGVPVVCADLPTLREHFTGEELTFFQAGNAEGLASALQSVALDGEAAAARATAALKRYRRDYAWPAQSERYRGLLADLSR
jgi:glycosyltransferase involved in cell wall biosynthesis